MLKDRRRLQALTIGTPGQAAVHFDDARSFCREREYLPKLASTYRQYGDRLLQRNESGDRAKATPLPDETLASPKGWECDHCGSGCWLASRHINMSPRWISKPVAPANTVERTGLRSRALSGSTVTVPFNETTERLGDQRVRHILRGHNAD